MEPAIAERFRPRRSRGFRRKDICSTGSMGYQYDEWLSLYTHEMRLSNQIIDSIIYFTKRHGEG